MEWRRQIFKISTCVTSTKSSCAIKADERGQVPQDHDKRRGMGAALRREELDGKTVDAVDKGHEQPCNLEIYIWRIIANRTKYRYGYISWQ